MEKRPKNCSFSRKRTEQRSKATQSFDASTLLSIDPELVEPPLEPPVEWPFGFAQGRELVERQMMP